MRISTFVVLLASSCSAPDVVPVPIPPPGPGPAVTFDRPPVQLSGTSLELPFEPVEARDLLLMGEVDGGQLVASSELTYAVGEGFPASVYVTSGQPPYAYSCERFVPGARPHWKQVVEDHGNGAVHLLVTSDEQLLMVLRGPGVARFVLAGDISLPDGGTVCQMGATAITRLPFQHALTVNAKQVSGVDLVTPWSRPGCDVRPTLVEGWNELPAAVLVEPRGHRFIADNAKRQVGLIFDAPGGIDGRSGYGYQLGAGLVTVRPQTQLQVRGPTTLTVVKPSQLTAFDVRFQLVTGPVKTPDYWELDGGSIGYDPRVWPRLELADAKAMVGAEPLCTPPSLSLRSSTPEVCDNDGWLKGPGICRLTAELAGTPLSQSLEVSVVQTP